MDSPARRGVSLRWPAWRAWRRGSLLAAVLGCLLAAPPGATAQAGDDSAALVAEFKRFFPKAVSPRERLEAVLVLSGIESVRAAEALLVALEDEDFAVQRAVIDVLGEYRQPQTAAWLLDEVLVNRKYAKRTVLRAGLTEAMGRMGHAFTYAPIAAQLKERDLALRLATIRSLGALRNPDACAALTPLAAGSDGTLALAAVDALARIGSAEGAQAAVLAALDHADWRVRARAIAAIVELRLKAGVRPLILRLGSEQGRLSGDAYTALKEVTLRDFGDTPESWLAWWDRNEAGFTMPDLEKVRAAREALARDGTRYTTGAKSFLGLQTRSENILFVIDVSGSMETPFSNRERLEQFGRTYASLERLEIVKEELTHTIQELPDTTNFNVIAFASGVKSWKSAPVRANVLNKNAAREWISKLAPLGGSKSGFRAQTGMSIDEASEGGTNTHLALMTALGAPPAGKGPAGFVADAPRSPLDTIFFLTDGEPTVGEILDMREMRLAVQRVNAYRGVAIHVIFVGEFGGKDFATLAQENGGIFVAIGG